jgi:hypothetical protein
MTKNEARRKLADTLMLDAMRLENSLHTRATCAWQAGFIYLLVAIGAEPGHDYFVNRELLRAEEKFSLPGSTFKAALAFLKERYDPHVEPKLQELLDWALLMRAFGDKKSKPPPAHWEGPELDEATMGILAPALARVRALPGVDSVSVGRYRRPGDAWYLLSFVQMSGRRAALGTPDLRNRPWPRQVADLAWQLDAFDPAAPTLAERDDGWFDSTPASLVIGDK